jgi:hypothetical protein
MAERTNIPISSACGEWEILLADAVDGQLKPGDEAAFTAHMAICPACAALFEDARLGREWLGFLSTEPEVPAGLLDKILAQTGPGQVEGFGLVADSGNMLPVAPRSTPVSIPVWQRPGFVGNVRRFAEPRLLMTAAMAFFSISATLSITNVRLSSLRLADLRPTAVRSLMERQLTMASVPIVRYCDHSNFVYEVRSTVRELRRATQIESEGGEYEQKQKDTAPGESRQVPDRKDGGSPIEPLQKSDNPTQRPALDDSADFLESSLTLQALPAHSGGSATAPRERSTRWTA